jgi:hypothetical protein
VVGRAQPRSSSIAQLSERLRARQKVRVEVRKLHQIRLGRTASPFYRRNGTPITATLTVAFNIQRLGLGFAGAAPT